MQGTDWLTKGYFSNGISTMEHVYPEFSSNTKGLKVEIK
jgi:hypothetical protein